MNLFLFFFSSVMILQGVFTLFLMLYAWNDPGKKDEYASPKSFLRPQCSFSILIPARHEENVIAETIQSLEKIRYPRNLFEIAIICQEKDTKTIDAVKKISQKLRDLPLKIVTFSGDKTSKPHALNIGVSHTDNEVIAVFDAEDEPHPDILQIINTVMKSSDVDVVQSGVQLMNFQSRWFSLLNVLEYFFWFKSFLQFFSRVGLIPLGGNTVFFKRRVIQDIGGWDELCLAEDADIGIRLSVHGAKIRVIYDEMHVTQEETPLTVEGFIRQRTRWNQGFLQIWRKKLWRKLPKFHERLFIVYILLWPIAQALFLFYLPLSFYLSITQKVPVGLALYANLPTYLLALQLATMCVGMWEFTQKFQKKFSIFVPFILVVSFLPYQGLLGISALRSLFRFFSSQSSWEKTYHQNAHRNNGRIK